MLSKTVSQYVRDVHRPSPGTSPALSPARSTRPLPAGSPAATPRPLPRPLVLPLPARTPALSPAHLARRLHRTPTQSLSRFTFRSQFSCAEPSPAPFPRKHSFPRHLTRSVLHQTPTHSSHATFNLPLMMIMMMMMMAMMMCFLFDCF